MLCTGGRAREQLQQAARDEDSISHASRSFLNSALSAVPALLIGFVCREGSDVVHRILFLLPPTSLVMAEFTPKWLLSPYMPLLLQIDHELSVPAVSSMLLSCTAWTVASVTGIMLFGTVSEGTTKRLSAFTAVGALILQVAVSPHIGGHDMYRYNFTLEVVP